MGVEVLPGLWSRGRADGYWGPASWLAAAGAEVGEIHGREQLPAPAQKKAVGELPVST
jgi:hypothetical protein